ncbi:MAG: sulfatase-like hydrolase/transferase [Pseudomonadota bacterium]
MTQAGITKPNIQKLEQALLLYFMSAYLLILFLVASTIEFQAVYAENKFSFVFLSVAFLMYGFFYLAPAFLLTHLTKKGLSAHLSKPAAQKAVYFVAIFTSAITTLLFYANAKLYGLYGMYINGFVLNLLMTPGGVESLGGSSASDIGFAAIAIGFLLLQAGLLWLIVRYVQANYAQSVYAVSQRLFGWKSALAALLMVVTVHMSYAYDLHTKHQLSTVAQMVPFYQAVSARGIFKSLGIKGTRSSSLKARGKLHYPLNPIQSTKPAKPYNIVWLVSESWRADTLNAHIMPNAWNFAQQSTRFTKNYSTGNGTRAGVFGMLMGLPSSYWFQFLQEQRGATILDVMRSQGYQMQFYTSALFSYPEFDKTIFAQMPAQQMHALQSNQKQGWQNDQQNVSDLLSFIDQRDTSKPFFTFMFFESPHARYYFPPESVIAKPYRDDLNYASLSKEALRTDIVPIKNRYINAVHHLDSQFGRVFDYLKQHQLLDNTIVILVGDHGEEFMEHGFWGHNSTFVDEQIRTPLVIYVPNKPAAVIQTMSSHADIVPTLMPMLGVSSPQADYSIGINLFSNQTRDHVYIADWDKLAYVDSEVKIVHPVNNNSLFKLAVTTSDDKSVPDAIARQIMLKKQKATMQVMQDLTHFAKPAAVNRVAH